MFRVARTWRKPATRPGRRRSASFGVKLGRTTKHNVLNTCAHFRCVSHSYRAATSRIVKFCQNFIDAPRRDARGWDATKMRIYVQNVGFYLSTKFHIEQHTSSPSRCRSWFSPFSCDPELRNFPTVRFLQVWRFTIVLSSISKVR